MGHSSKAPTTPTEVVGIVERAATTEKPNGWLGFADEVEGFQGYTFTGLPSF